MKKFELVVNVYEEASIDYTIIVEANSEREAQDIVEKAIKEDGTAFIQFDCVEEKIIDSVKIDGEDGEVDSVREIIEENNNENNT